MTHIFPSYTTDECASLPVHGAADVAGVQFTPSVEDQTSFSGTPPGGELLSRPPMTHNLPLKDTAVGADLSGQAAPEVACCQEGAEVGAAPSA